MKNWTDKVLGQFGLLTGGSTNLDQLAAEAPTGQGSFDAMRAVFDVLELHDFIDPAEGAAAKFERSGPAVSHGVRNLIAALVANVEAALDAGHQDESDPLIRPKDFGKLERIGGGRFAGATIGPLDPLRSWTGGSTPGIAAGSPLWALEPWVLSDGRRAAVLEFRHLGAGRSRWWRLSRIRHNTGIVIEHGRNEAAALERTRQAEAEQKLMAAANLEREAKRLRSVAP